VDRGAKGLDLSIDLPIDFGDCCVEAVYLLQMQAQQEAVMPGDTAAPRFAQRLGWCLDPTVGQLGQPLRARRGAKKAIGALAASILTAAYHMLKDDTLYHDLGPDHFDRGAKATQTKHPITRLQNLGYAVQITPLAA
jgi:hypothetical protein